MKNFDLNKVNFKELILHLFCSIYLYSLKKEFLKIDLLFEEVWHYFFGQREIKKYSIDNFSFKKEKKTKEFYESIKYFYKYYVEKDMITFYVKVYCCNMGISFYMMIDTSTKKTTLKDVDYKKIKRLYNIKDYNELCDILKDIYKSIEVKFIKLEKGGKKRKAIKSINPSNGVSNLKYLIQKNLLEKENNQKIKEAIIEYLSNYISI